MNRRNFFVSLLGTGVASRLGLIKLVPKCACLGMTRLHDMRWHAYDGSKMVYLVNVPEVVKS